LRGEKKKDWGFRGVSFLVVVVVENREYRRLDSFAVLGRLAKCERHPIIFILDSSSS